MTSRLLRYAGLAACTITIAPMAAAAHSIGTPHVDALGGLLHPFTGIDHLVAMLAVGIWAAQMNGRARWLLPLTFVCLMAAGGMLGAGGLALPFIEQGIVGSVLVLGLVIVAAVRPPLAASMPLVGLMALMHGFAHGAELPSGASFAAYGAGFLVATAALHASGFALAWTLNRTAGAAALRVTGAAVIAAGIVMVVGG